MEEINEFINTFPGFFGDVKFGAVKVDIELSGPDFEYIYYKDLIKTDAFKEELEYMAN